MDQCKDIAPLLTAWVDGATDAESAERVIAHLAACPACASRATAERTVRRLLHDRRASLASTRAPEALRARLEAMRPVGPVQTTWGRVRLAMAATLVLAVSGVTLHVVTGRSATVLAAQLTADHAKCHLTEHQEEGLAAATARDRLAERYGFYAQVPPGTADDRLRLVGARRCLTGDGTNAHILYRYNGRPVSLYLLPSESRPDATVDVFGERSVVWSRHNGTYVLVADAAMEGLPQLAAYMQQATR